MDLAEHNLDEDADDVVSVGSDSDDGLEMVGEKKSDDPVNLNEKLSSKLDEVLRMSLNHVIVYNECLDCILSVHLA